MPLPRMRSLPGRPQQLVELPYNLVQSIIYISIM